MLNNSTFHGDACTTRKPLRWLVVLMLLLAATAPATLRAHTAPDPDDDPDARMTALMEAVMATTETQFEANTPVLNSQFGRSVSLDGNFALVGAYLENNMGAAYIFEETASMVWTQQARLTASDGATNDWFGNSVSLSGDYAIVGAPRDNFSQGAAYIFEKPVGGWTNDTEDFKLVASVPANGNQLGTSVSIDASVERAIVGAILGDNTVAANSGTVYVFERDGSGDWGVSCTIVGSSETCTEGVNGTFFADVGDGVSGDQFGKSVSLDGSRALVGALNGDGNQMNSGAAYVFELISGNWTQQVKLEANDGVGSPPDQFGTSVSLDGDDAFVGSPRDDNAKGVDAGAAYVFVKPVGGWSTCTLPCTETAKLLASDGMGGDQFGVSVAVENGRAVVGAPFADIGLEMDAGAIYRFDFNLTWPVSETEKLMASDGMDSDDFGFSSSVSLSGGRALIGAPNADVDPGPTTVRAGKSYVFDFATSNDPPTVVADNAAVNVDEGMTAVNAGSFTDTDGDDVTITASVGTITFPSPNTGIGNWSWSYPTTDGPDDGQTVTITADDGNGGVAQTTFDLTVNNVAPTVTAVTIPVAPVDIDDQPVSAGGTFTDPANAADAPFTCTVDYGDGSGPQAGTVVGFGCNGPNQTYADAGVYTVTVTVTDDDGDSGSLTATAFIVIYDPSEGFVTGGGWFVSPEGSYPANPSLTGSANFGFVSKYKKNSSAPTGQTEFQFQLADLNFHSDTYEWMTVHKDKASYHGTGTINGSGTYDFLIIVTDAALSGSEPVDLFRIRIKNTGLPGNPVVYDNRLGEADNSNAGTPISGGNIKIHKGGPNKAGDAVDPVTISEELPTAFALDQNYPNPFNPTTTLAFDLPEASDVQLVVFDVMGRKVDMLLDGSLAAGRHTVSWRANNLPSGVYFYRITAGSFVQVRQMTLLK